MENKAIIRSFGPILLIFIALTIGFVVAAGALTARGIDYRVLLTGNGLLFIVTAASFFLYIRGLRNKNVNAFIRAMYGSLLIKFFVCLVAVLIYAMIARSAVNKWGIVGCFLLYVIYTFMEVQTLLRMSKKPNNA